MTKTNNAERQARYQKSQHALGRKPRTYWLTGTEASLVMELIYQLRKEGQNIKQEALEKRGHKRYLVG